MDCSGSNKRPRVGFGYAERQDARGAKQVWAEVTRAEVTPKEKEELHFESFSDQRREEFLVEMTKVADDEHEKRMMVFRNEGLDKAVELTAMQRLQRARHSGAGKLSVNGNLRRGGVACRRAGPLQSGQAR